MQFQVPQFIEVEDKIFGPLTFKQFIYIIGGAGCSYILWRIFTPYIAAPLIILVGGGAAALAFLQVNKRPFIVALENGFFYFMKSKLYLWSNTRKTRAAQENKKQEAIADTYIPHLSESKLHDLAWSLDIQERIQSGTASNEDRDMYAARSGTKNVVAPVRTARDARI
ncbi:MAG TPA: PrgI family protein [Candidatus Paceibacterota bacterium]